MATRETPTPAWIAVAIGVSLASVLLVADTLVDAARTNERRLAEQAVCRARLGSQTTAVKEGLPTGGLDCQGDGKCAIAY